MQGGGEGILQQQWIPEVEEDIRRTDDVNKVQLDIRLGHSRTVENVMKMLTDEGPLQGVTVCDAGCGTECLSIPLAKEGAIVSASDISVAMVAEAKKQADNRLILSFAPKTFYYDLLKRIGELFPGPSKAPRAYLHTEADVERALTRVGWRIRRRGLITTQFYFAKVVEAVPALG
nr:magnesium protoporphyrin IX methyltransferase, chloroplastic [Ipomoea batatas]